MLASGFHGDEGALPIQADARALGATLKAGEGARHALPLSHRAYLVGAQGCIEVNGDRMDALDGVAISHTQVLEITAIEDSELVMVDAG
jgi:redox-sensitive bicupin YhaK (pirin superfamily)